MAGDPRRAVGQGRSVRMRARFASSLLGLVIAAGGCVGTPSVAGVAGVPPSPGTAWTPPRQQDRAPDSIARLPVPPDLEQRIKQLSLAEVVDLGLRNNP